jgi:hypothetical protein
MQLLIHIAAQSPPQPGVHFCTGNVVFTSVQVCLTQVTDRAEQTIQNQSVWK